MLSNFYKKNKTDKIWWIDNLETFGEHLFSFDKKHIYNLFQDYPYNMTDVELVIDNNIRFEYLIIKNKSKAIEKTCYCGNSNISHFG